MGNTGSFLCFGEHSMLPCFSLPGIVINLKIDNWSVTDRLAKTVIRFSEMVIRIICKNSDQNWLPKCHLQFSVIRFAVFNDQIHLNIWIGQVLKLEAFPINNDDLSNSVPYSSVNHLSYTNQYHTQIVLLQIALLRNIPYPSRTLYR